MLKGEQALSDIGDALGLSGERVRQLIASDAALTRLYVRMRRNVDARAARRHEADATTKAERERARQSRRATIATMLAAGCSFVEIGKALGVNYKGPAHTTRNDPALQAIYDAAADLRKARTSEKMSVAHMREASGKKVTS